MNEFVSQLIAVPYTHSTVYSFFSELKNFDNLEEFLPPPSPDFPFRELMASIRLFTLKKEPPHSITFQAVSSPIPFNIVLRIAPIDDASSSISLTFRSDAHPFLFATFRKPLQNTLDHLAQSLLSLPMDRPNYER